MMAYNFFLEGGFLQNQVVGNVSGLQVSNCSSLFMQTPGGNAPSSESFTWYDSGGTFSSFGVVFYMQFSNSSDPVSCIYFLHKNA